MMIILPRTETAQALGMSLPTQARHLFGLCCCGAEVGHDAVIEKAAHAAYPDTGRPVIASCSVLRRAIGTAMYGLIVVPPEEPNVAVLAKAGAPGVLNSPVLRLPFFTVADGKDRVTNQGIPTTAIIDARAVVSPVGGDRNCHRATGDERYHQVLVLVLWQTLPTYHAEFPARSVWSSEADTRGRLMMR